MPDSAQFESAGRADANEVEDAVRRGLLPLRKGIFGKVGEIGLFAVDVDCGELIAMVALEFRSISAVVDSRPLRDDLVCAQKRFGHTVSLARLNPGGHPRS